MEILSNKENYIHNYYILLSSYHQYGKFMWSTHVTKGPTTEKKILPK